MHKFCSCVNLILESDASIKQIISQHLRPSSRLREELCSRAGNSENCRNAALRSVAPIEQLSEKSTKTIHSIALKPRLEISSAWRTTYRVFSGWAWHAPDKSDSVSSFWSEGWAWGPALVEPGARTALWPLLAKVCSYSRGSASPASLNVARPEKKHGKRTGPY